MKRSTILFKTSLADNVQRNAIIETTPEKDGFSESEWNKVNIACLSLSTFQMFPREETT